MSPVAPCEGAETVSSAMGLSPLEGIMSPAVTTDLPLKVVPSPVIGCFSRLLFFEATWLVGEAFLRSLAGEKSERCDSNLNESTKMYK